MADESKTMEAEKVTAKVYDETLDTYVDKEVTKEEYTQLVAEPLDSPAIDALDTSNYPQDMAYYWCNASNRFGSQSDARDKGYAPVRNSPGNRHHLSDVPGLGRVVAYGDLVLFAAPKEKTLLRRAREEKKRHEYEEMVLEGAKQRIEDFAHEHGMTFKGGMESHEEILYPDEDDEYGDDTREDADSYAAAAAASYEQAASGRRSFGGFDGPMEKGIPESPINRAIRGRNR